MRNTIQNAINESIQHDTVVVLYPTTGPEYTASTAALAALAQDWTELQNDPCTMNQYWGIEEGNAWRVHIVEPD